MIQAKTKGHPLFSLLSKQCPTLGKYQKGTPSYFSSQKYPCANTVVAILTKLPQHIAISIKTTNSITYNHFNQNCLETIAISVETA